MKEFIVEVTETLVRQVPVMARNADEAYASVKAQYDAQEIILDADDFFDTDIVVLDDPMDPAIEESMTITDLHQSIIDRLLAHRKGIQPLADDKREALLSTAAGIEEVLDDHYQKYGDKLPDIRRQYSQVIASHEMKYAYDTIVTIDAKKNYLDHQYFLPNAEHITNIQIKAINLETKEVSVFDHERIKQAFDYFAGNVEGDIIEYFDWAYVRFLFLEELD